MGEVACHVPARVWRKGNWYCKEHAKYFEEADDNFQTRLSRKIGSSSRRLGQNDTAIACLAETTDIAAEETTELKEESSVASMKCSKGGSSFVSAPSTIAAATNKGAGPNDQSAVQRGIAKWSAMEGNAAAAWAQNGGVDVELQSAATRIQATFRGRLARQQQL